MQYPSAVTLDAKRARRILAGANSRFYAKDKRALKKRARAFAGQRVQRMRDDASRFDEETFQTERFTALSVC